MVDLVKIRRKAKKAAADAAAEGERLAASGEREKQDIAPDARGARPGAPATELTQDSGLRTQDSAQSTQDAGLGTQDVGLGPQDAAPGSEDSALGTRHSALTKLERFKQDAGKRREGLVSAEASGDSSTLLELITFHIAGEQYALDIEHIVEIVPPREATRVPNADGSIVGIISLRGTIVTIVDVRKRLRHQTAPTPGPETRVVVVQYGGETIGFEVDRVLRVVKVDRGAVEPHPVVHTSEQSEAIRGVFRQANALTILLDFDKLLDARHGTHL